MGKVAIYTYKIEDLMDRAERNIESIKRDVSRYGVHAEYIHKLKIEINRLNVIHELFDENRIQDIKAARLRADNIIRDAWVYTTNIEIDLRAKGRVPN